MIPIFLFLVVFQSLTSYKLDMCRLSGLLVPNYRVRHLFPFRNQTLFIHIQALQTTQVFLHHYEPAVFQVDRKSNLTLMLLESTALSSPKHNLRRLQAPRKQQQKIC